MSKSTGLQVSKDGFRYAVIDHDIADAVRFFHTATDLHSVSLKKVNCSFDLTLLRKIPIINFFDSDYSKCDTESIVTGLRGVKSLSLLDSVFPKSFDFKDLRELEELSIDFNKTYLLSGLTKLRSLILKRISGSGLSLGSQDSLEVLELIQGSLTTLKGIESLKSLKAITLFNLSKISSNSLVFLSCLESLEYLHLKNFKHEIDFSLLKNNKRLRWIILEDSPNVVEVDTSISNFKKLEGFQVIGKTNLLNPVLELLKQFSSYRYGYFLENSVKDRLIHK